MGKTDLNSTIEHGEKGNRIGYLEIFMAGVLWGFIGFFVKKLTGAGAGSELIAFMRISTACALMFAIVFVKKGIKGFTISKRSLISCIVLGVLSQALFNVSYNTAIREIGVAIGSVLLYTAPVFVCILSAIVFKEKISIKKGLLIALNIVGCFLVVTNGDFSVLGVSVPFSGILFGILAGFLYSLVTIIGRIASGKEDPFVINFYMFLFGTLTLCPIAKPWETIPLVSSGNFWLYAIGYGLIPTVGSYMFYFSGLTHNLELSKVPVIASVEIIVSVFIGIFVFAEGWGLMKFIGIAIIITSIVLTSRDEGKGREKP